jgi:hypothetical protein
MLELIQREGQGLRIRANMLFAGLYAWVTTVATPCTYRGASSLARWTAFAALLGLLVGPIFVLERPRLARALGVHGFFGCSLLTWLLLGSLVSVDRLDPIRSALGALGWALFALGWGTTRRLNSVPEDDPHVIAGAVLSPRGLLSKGALVTLGLGICGTLLPMTLAWRVVRPEHALLAQSAALLCALAIIDAASKIALGRRGQPRVMPSVRQRITFAWRPLAILAVVLGLGAIGLALR